VVSSGEQAAFAYFFRPDRMLEPMKFGLLASVYYYDEVIFLFLILSLFHTHTHSLTHSHSLVHFCVHAVFLIFDAGQR
jgi:hypothetical protein